MWFEDGGAAREIVRRGIEDSPSSVWNRGGIRRGRVVMGVHPLAIDRRDRRRGAAGSVSFSS